MSNSNGKRPAFQHTTAEELYQTLPAKNRERLAELSRLTGVSYGSVYYPYLVCCEYYLYLLTTKLNQLPSRQQIDTLLLFMQNYERNITTLGERTETAMQEVIKASNPNGVARYLAISFTVTGLCAFLAGSAFTSWAKTNTQLTNISNTSDVAWQVYYLNQEAMEECQKRFKSKLRAITCPQRLVVPSK
ncbi:MAG: hypothetical protein H0U45_15860 [Tatlockia sp.]|nr:hypothetical protein [Tatlockia sp.]